MIYWFLFADFHFWLFNDYGQVNVHGCPCTVGWSTGRTSGANCYLDIMLYKCSVVVHRVKRTLTVYGERIEGFCTKGYDGEGICMDGFCRLVGWGFNFFRKGLYARKGLYITLRWICISNQHTSRCISTPVRSPTVSFLCLLTNNMPYSKDIHCINQARHVASLSSVHPIHVRKLLI